MNFHITNFHKNKIMWKPKQIRKYVNDIKQQSYPKNEYFINNIISIKIQFNEIETYFCSSKIKFYDEDKNKYEKILVFTTNFQLNILKEINMIFIDSTFKFSPCNFYQILNIVGYSDKKDLFIPIFSALLTSKTEKIYNYALLEFRKLIKSLNKKIDFKKYNLWQISKIN